MVQLVEELRSDFVVGALFEELVELDPGGVADLGGVFVHELHELHGDVELLQLVEDVDRLEDERVVDFDFFLGERGVRTG